jgi:hypothetical protein
MPVKRRDSEERSDLRVGLCSTCAHAAVVVSAKDVAFWRCGRADSDASFQRYPALPVHECTGFVFGDPDARGRTVD